VLHVHGYHQTVDQAWERYHLAEQFRASGQNALFIVPGAPASREERVRWTSLARLLQTVARQTRVAVPRGLVVAMGHSGAFRTIVAWLDYPWLRQVILLDALYANEKELEYWLEIGPRHEQHRMFIVAEDTRAKSEAFVAGVPHAVKRARIPAEVGELSRRERRARLLYLDSQYKHDAIVASGKVIPLLLRLTQLACLPERAR